MIFYLLWPILIYCFDGLVVVLLIQALGNDELDFTSLLAVGVATAVVSLLLDILLEHEFGQPGFFSACGVTALVLGAALKLIWDVEPKRVVLICLFFWAFHYGGLRIAWL